jgi:transcriptional regulator with XRE-family HTH domain
VGNDRLRAARKAAGLSQTRLADLVNQATGRDTMDGNAVSRLERGVVTWPGQAVREALTEVLGVPVDELGFVRHSASAKAVQDTTRAVDGGPADADYVEGQRRMIIHLAALDGMHGGAEVAPLALRSFRRAQRLLGEGHYDPAVERDLEAVTAEMGELAGWLLFDAERQEESRTTNAEALTLARIAGDASMEWFILSNQALASIHTGRNREALRISQGMTCGQDLPGRVRALFDVRAARALGALGDGPAALRTFDRARSAFADGVTNRDPAWSWWFDERELAGHEGMIRASLGDYDGALPLLAEAVERSEGREQFRWALYIHRANLLRMLLRAASYGEAERVALDVAPMVGEIASARTEKLLLAVTAKLRPDMALPSTLGDTLRHIGRHLDTDYRR